MSWESILREKVPEWNDDAKMREMFSPLPLTRDLDPLRWDSLMEFWAERVLPEALRDSNQLSFTIDQLKSNFKRGGYFPSGLEGIVAEMRRKGTVVSEGQVAAAQAGGGWSSWLWGALVTKPLSWGWSQVATSEDSHHVNVDPKARLVLMPLLQAKADALLAQHADEAVFAADHLLTQRQLAESSGLAAHDLQLVLTHLAHAGKAALFETPRGERAVKLARAGEGRVALTDADRGILQLKETLASLEKQETQLAHDIDGCRAKAADWLKKKNRAKATMELKRKQRLQSLLDKRLSFIDNIHQILHTIEQTQTDKEMLDQFRLGVDTLKRVREDSGVTAEAAHEVMDDLQEALLDQREIDDVIAAGQDQLGAADEAELEDELAQLIAETSPSAVAAVASAPQPRERVPEAPAQVQTQVQVEADDAELTSLLARLPSVRHLPDPALTLAEEPLPEPDELEFAG